METEHHGKRVGVLQPMTQKSDSGPDSSNTDPELAEEEEWNRAGNAQAQPSQRQRQDQAKRTRDLAEREHRLAKTLTDQAMPVMPGNEHPEAGSSLGKRHDRPEVPKTMLDHSFFDAHFQSSHKRDERVAEPLVVGKIEKAPVFADEMPQKDGKAGKKQSSMNALTISGVLLLLACMLAICFLPRTATTTATKPATAGSSAKPNSTFMTSPTTTTNTSASPASGSTKVPTTFSTTYGTPPSTTAAPNTSPHVSPATPGQNTPPATQATY